MEKDLVSIIIPVYNQEKYLDAALKSTIDQDYCNIEIIVVNDGSTDSGMNIAENFAKIDPRIKIFYKENGGLVDATIFGVNQASGKYIVFFDPDDYIGSDFISNFMHIQDGTLDFIAAGFFYDDAGSLKPYFLKEDKYLSKDDLSKIENSFLLDSSSVKISNELFISRWNKLYKKKLVDKTIIEFSNFKNITLGEDTLFTFCMLKNSERAATISSPNTYYYNVSNQNSMMRSDAIENYIEKCNLVYETFATLLQQSNLKLDQAQALLYFLINSLFQREKKASYREFSYFYKLLRKKSSYNKALRFIILREKSIKKRISFYCQIVCPSGMIYMFLLRNIKRMFNILITTKGKIAFYYKNIPKNGMKEAMNTARFIKRRKNAFSDLEKYLPILEKEVQPFLKKYVGMETNLDNSPIKNDIFIFWWDGFEKLPPIVSKCIESIHANYPDYSIHKIDKDNFMSYTDIHPKIVLSLKEGSISIQSFSDILRFNLLKNNGGVWIDATIFFFNKIEINENLTHQGFTTLCFDSTNSFLRYKSEMCTWSGYFIASRKNSVFSRTVDHVFQSYFLKYGDYKVYFFIDAVLMICKINKIDNDCLSKPVMASGDMFLLSKILNKKFNPILYKEIRKLPQKLMWYYKGKENSIDSFYEKILEGLESNNEY